ncbi:hypothetical protein CFP65_5053 [Kitasatospora sp. MMS16-BH015]|uniref:right-handed parallel beta-helix repeat-containing protein n=1 Tax=Kitasatospora sp. MMS16-BH015 TaxID=2018025 RepID=UPI000CA1F973|nr:right-handed parallel beta-helix repeat-containing protein [Kitasatospora sp. MMS16-BH015]AUG79766.1 hypothetical protein CFP65_5053 [Kitasatospora sp. MMS16-BH015]
MSRARRRRQLATAVVVAATSLVGAGATLPAVAVDTDTLYVDNSAAAHCSNFGSGSQAQPFCTVQAGVDHAKAGQTVQVAGGGGRYAEQVTVHSSGEPGKPIVLAGRPSGPRPSVGVSLSDAQPENAVGFLLDKVHDVTIRNFAMEAIAAEGVLVRDSAAVTIERTTMSDTGMGNGASGQRAVPAGAPAVRVTGTSSRVTVAQNLLQEGHGDAVAVEAGVSGAVVTTNGVMTAQPRGIRVTDAPGTVVTSNSVITLDGAGVTLAGASDHAVVENNVLAHEHFVKDGESSTAELSVSAGSTVGTKADYNSVHGWGSGAAYSWAGTDHHLADFAAVSGQGAHDVEETPPLGLDGNHYGTVKPTGASGATDSADASAPGMLTTDLAGRPRVDDPQVANSGTGAGYYDRGALELQAVGSLTVLADRDQGPYPLPVTVTATARQNWPDTLTYTYDFGDGSEPLTTTDAKVEHVYRAAGTRTVKVTATGTDGTPATGFAGGSISVNEPAELAPVLGVNQVGFDGPFSYNFALYGSTSPWPLTGYELDFGDGSPKETHEISYGAHHSYRRPGDYTLTATVKDGGGRAATVRQVLHVGYGKMGYTPITPTRVLDTRKPGTGGRPQRLGPGQSVTVDVPTPFGQPDADAAVLNVTAVNPSQAGYLSVYPAGTDRPPTSNVNFAAGQTVPNLVTVPTGQDHQVTVYNFSGTTDVVVDVMGSYRRSGGSGFGAVSPVRLLDTRKSAALDADSSVSVQVRGVGGVPDDATAVVLNLTSTGSDAGGYLTAYANWTARPGTSNLNFTAGQTVANQVVVPIGADGKVAVYNHTGRTHVVADVFGYYGPSGSSLFTPVVPTRLVDTRQSSALGQGGVLKVDTGVPAGATGAVLNVTDTASTVPGYLTVWADKAPKPGTSNVNFPAGKTVPNHVTTPLGANGAFDVYNFMGRSQVVADLFGYFAK